MNKKTAIKIFNESWKESVKNNPELKTDKPAKRES